MQRYGYTGVLRRESNRRKFAIITTLFFVVIVMGEIACMIYIYLICGNELRDHYSGGRVTEIYKPTYVKLRQNTIWKNYKINGDGLLGDQFSDKSENAIKVLAIGGSTSFYGNYMNAVKKLYAKRLAKKQKVYFSSSGTPGYLSYQSLILFKRNLIQLNPNIIIIYHGINDLLPLRVRGVDVNDFNDCMARYTSLIGNSINYRDNLFDRSALYTLMYNQILYIKRFFITKWYDEMDLKKLRSFENNIEDLIDTAKLHGMTVIVLTFANSKVNENRKSPWGIESVAAKGIALNNAVLFKLAAKHKVTFVDAAGYLSGKKEYFIDFCHFSEKGVNKFAEILMPHIALEIENLQSS